MLTEIQIKAIIKKEKEHLESINNHIERKTVGAFIAGLECALNE